MCRRDPHCQHSRPTRGISPDDSAHVPIPADDGFVDNVRPHPRRPGRAPAPSGGASDVTVGTALHPRTAPLNARMQWREWSGLLRRQRVPRQPRHRVQRDPRGGRAHRRQPALQVRAPRPRRPPPRRPADHPRCDEADARAGSSTRPGATSTGKVIDDGTIHRLDDADGGQVIRWTAADPQYRWLRMNAHGLDVDVDDVSERDAAIALQGPLARKVLEAATGDDFGDLALLPAPDLAPGRHPGRRLAHRLHGRPRLRAVDPRRSALSRPGTSSSRPASRTGSARPGCSPST